MVVATGMETQMGQIAGLLLEMGFGDVVLCDIQGALYRGAAWMNPAQAKMAEISNRKNRRGSLAEVLLGADVFIGVSRPGLVTAEMVATMAKEPIVFAMANPTPEILPEEAKKGGAAVVGTGRSDYPNQINNVLVFPGIFKGALAVRAREITDSMKVAAARAIAGLIGEELNPDYILPAPFDPRVAEAVAQAVAEEAVRLGLNRRQRREG